MSAPYRVLMEPVPREHQKQVMRLLQRFLGPESRGQVKELVRRGGVVMDRLAEPAAETVVDQLQDLGATALVEKTDDDGEPGTGRPLYRVELRSFGERKIQVIRAVRDHTDLGLREAKRRVDELGIIASGQTEKQAHRLAERLRAAGATVELVPAREPESDDEEPVPGGPCEVFGRVQTASGDPLAGVLVRAYDRDLRSAQFLGESSTDPRGAYRISYSEADFDRAEKSSADLEIRVYNEVGTRLETTSDPGVPVYDAPPRQKLSLTLDPNQVVEPSEYERLISYLEPLLEDVDPAELTAEDRTFLHRETELDSLDDFPAGSTSLDWLVAAARLEQRTEVEKAAVYGWGRVGVFSMDEPVELGVEDLLEPSNRDLEAGLRTAVEQELVPFDLDSRSATILARVDRLRKRHRSFEDPSAEPLTGRLVTDQPGSTWEGYTVQVVGERPDQEPRLLDQDLTDPGGGFRVASGSGERERWIRVLDPRGQEVDRRPLDETGSIQEWDIPRVDESPIQTGTSNPSLESLAEELDLSLPDTVRDRFREQKIQTLSDLRAAGGVRGVFNGDRPEDDPDLDQLEAQTHMNLLSPDLSINTSLIEAGFHHPRSVADVPRDDFIETVRTRIPPVEAGRLHASATAQVRLLNQRLTDVLVNSLEDDTDTFPRDLDLEDLIPLRCRCRECESAVSPRSYLTDLLQYLLRNVRRESGGELTVEDFEATFHQPFTRLPTTCTGEAESIRVIRLALEVLLRHHGEDSLDFLLMVDGDAQQYRETVYRELLAGLGTSPAELEDRLAGNPEGRGSLAQRLGIRAEHLQELHLDPRANLVLAESRSEQNMERLFGFEALTRAEIVIDLPEVVLPDPLRSVGEPSFLEWRHEHLRDGWRDQDHPANPYLLHERCWIDPDRISPADFRTSDKSNSPAFSLWVNRRQWVDDRLDRLQSLTQSVDGQTIPDLEVMLDRMTGTDVYEYDGQLRDGPWAGAPDRSGWPDLLERARQGPDAESARKFIQDDLLLTPDELDRLLALERQFLSHVRDPRQPAPDAGDVDEFRSLLVAVQVRDLEETWIQEEQSAGIRYDTNTFWVALREPRDGPWDRRLQAHAKDQPFLDPQKIKPGELLAGTAGRIPRAIWQERRDRLDDKRSDLRGVLESTGVDDMLNEVYESVPAEPNWDQYFETRLEGLADRGPAVAASTLESIEQELFLTGEDTEASFRHLATLRTKAQADPDSEIPAPGEAEVERSLDDLVTAWKRRTLLPGGTASRDWVQEEQDRGVTEYWLAYRARLPRHRASRQERGEWQQTLRDREAPPTVDPDQLDLQRDFANTPDPNPAESLWADRRQWLADQRSRVEQHSDPENLLIELGGVQGAGDLTDPILAALEDYPLREELQTLRQSFDPSIVQEIESYLKPSMPVLNQILKQELGITVRELVELRERRSAGETVETRLRQLTLEHGGFTFLLDVHDRLARSQDLDESELEQLYDLAVAVRKRRRFGRWQDEERDRGILCSPEFFRLSDRSSSPDPEATERVRFRYRPEVRRGWRRTLETRIQQQRDAADALGEAVDDAERAALPVLRDVLVEKWNGSGDDLHDKGEELTRRLGVDVNDSGCRETTRVEQAIETLQQIVLTLRTGRPRELHDGTGLELVVDGFDDEWDWMGSYSSWKAAMSLHLYPENVLMPGLRESRQQTPLFRELRESLEPSRLTPAGACDVARRYEQYLREVADLEIEATCWAPTRSPEGSTCEARENPSEPEVLFMVGRHRETGHVYWSIFDPEAPFPRTSSGLTWATDDRYPQTFWRRLEDPKLETVERIAGVTYYRRHVHLFLKTRSTRESSLVLLRLDPRDRRLVDVNELDVGDDVGEFSAVLLQRSGGDGSRPPSLVMTVFPEKHPLRVGAGSMLTSPRTFMHYVNDLNEDGTDWAGDWRRMLIFGRSVYGEERPEVAAALEIGDRILVFTNVAESEESSSFVDVDLVVLRRSNLDFNLEEDIVESLSDVSSFQLTLRQKRDAETRHRNLSNKRARVQSRINYHRRRVYNQLKAAGVEFLHDELVDWIQNRPHPIQAITEFLLTTASVSGFAHLMRQVVRAGLSPAEFQDWLEELVDRAEELRLAYVRRDRVNADIEDARRRIDMLEQRIRNSAGSEVFEQYEEWMDGFQETRGGGFGRLIAAMYWPEGTTTDDDLYLVSRARQSGRPQTWVRWIRDLPESQAEMDGEKDVFFGTNFAQEYLFPSALGGTVHQVARHGGPATVGTGRWLAYNEVSGKYGNGPLVQELDLSMEYEAVLNLPLAPRLGFDRAPDGELLPEWGSIKIDFTESQRRDRAWWLDSTLRSNKMTAARTVPLRTNLVYLWEAYYFLPVQIAIHLRRAGEFEAALEWLRTVYDYSAPASGDRPRKIFPHLRAEESFPGRDRRGDGWLVNFDPVDPHSIAMNRRHAYTRFTLHAIVRCVLDYAGSEFTRDTSESVSRARDLYALALDLLEAKELQPPLAPCDELTLDVPAGDEEPLRQVQVLRLKDRVESLNEYELRRDTLREVQTLLAENSGDGEAIEQAASVLETAEQKDREAVPVSELFEGESRVRAILDSELTRDPGVSSDLVEAAQQSAGAYDRRLHSGFAPWTGISSSILMDRPIEELSEEEMPVLSIDDLENLDNGHDVEVEESSRQGPNLGRYLYHFCVPANPLAESLRTRARVNLQKIRNCRNIAGMRRELEPYSAPTDVESGLPRIGAGGALQTSSALGLQPTPYRFSTLMDRAKELVGISQNMESSFLSVLEKRDREEYSLLQARQDLEVTRAGVRLQSLRVREARDQVNLAELQRERSTLRVNQIEEWLQRGLNQYERTMIDSYERIAEFQQWAAAFRATAQSANAAVSATQLTSTPAGWTFWGVVTAAAASEAYFTSRAAGARADVQIASLRASHERRVDQWELEKTLAEQNERIGDQEIRIAEDHVDVVEQEREIAELRSEHAGDILEFLNNKFTNAELYDWMGDILADVYRYFLQQAASTARLAEQQLAFERQEVPPGFIESDYWSPPSDAGGVGSSDDSTDRRGLTGSARLLQDTYELDQYAFKTDQRKHQIRKTLSLANLFPVEMEQFRRDGVLRFDTPMELFDRDHPGQYLRLIRTVQVSVLALTPPADGIKASLWNTGLSRVVTGGDVFQTRVIHRSPESVTLSSPQGDDGLFQLRPDEEMLLPFEKTGVDTGWELRLPRAANAFDYRSLSDVLFTVEYTALESDTYRRQVLQRLDSRVSGDLSFSLKHDFPDPWYDLHNPDQTDDPMRVQFELGREDYPPNLTDLRVDHVLVYLSVEDPDQVSDWTVDLQLDPRGPSAALGGEARPIDGLISTRKGNGSAWMSLQGKHPEGRWTFSLPDTHEVRSLLQREALRDVLLVVTYSADQPDWPEA